MVRWGVVLLGCGALGEVLGNNRFRSFFDWRYPHEARPFDDAALRVKFGRGMVIIDAVLLLGAGLGRIL